MGMYREYTIKDEGGLEVIIKVFPEDNYRVELDGELELSDVNGYKILMETMQQVDRLMSQNTMNYFECKEVTTP